MLGGEALLAEAKEKAAEKGLANMEELFRSMAKRGKQANLSFFAFTATPKHKTRAVFGRNGRPFHRYTMRQAIEEKFIMDVLKNYATYATYYKLLKACQDDPNVERKKAARALARFMRLHPHNIAQKTEVMVEHFNAVTRHKIGGKAKAMVVTGSRLEAVRYKQSFDQPFLHTMYVDKRLAGLQAVQTLSRLNRTHPLKEDTFVLDFVNDRKEIQEAFKTYYEGAQMGEEVEPSRMYELKSELDASGIYLANEVQHFCEIYFKPKLRQSAGDHKAMNAALDPAVDRFQALQQENEDEAELWRGKLFAFRNLYAFLSQIIPYQDSDLERLYTFLRHLATKLPKRRGGPR